VFYLIKWFFVRIYYGILNILQGNGAKLSMIPNAYSKCYQCKDPGKLLTIYS
jgi:hypothetical protein